MFPRSTSDLERVAKNLGQQAAAGTRPDNQAVQILCAIVEELAANLEKLEREIQALKLQK